MLEIERKYLINTLPDLTNISCEEVIQGYLSFIPEIRIRKKGKKHYLTCKGEGTLTRTESEMEIDECIYQSLKLLQKGNIVEKTRFQIPLNHNLTGELDIYHGNLEGLVTIEIEFPSADVAIDFNKPDWFGKEVTQYKCYKNKNLAQLNECEILSLLEKSKSYQKT